MKINPTVLAIDTSCDETSCSIIHGLTVLSNVLPSQMEYHKKYGGVVPNLARLAHQERIDNVISEAMKKAQVTFDDINAIAVTIGPGLAIALEVGIKKAKELAEKYKKPLITVNHMEGHLLSALAKKNSTSPHPSPDSVEGGPLVPAGRHGAVGEVGSEVEFPVLGFLISGGHTELILVKNWGDYKKIGQTLDDSCGEAYDKCGRILGLGYPAGPIISEFAKNHRDKVNLSIKKDNKSTLLVAINKNSNEQYELPIAMANSGNLNFSFSGLKTAFSQLVNSLVDGEITVEDQMKGNVRGLSKEQIFDLCVAFEAAAIEQLKTKLKKAIEEYLPTQVWLGGGVVASSRLRSQLRSICRQFNIQLTYPYSKKLTTDNAAMIGVAASIKIQTQLSSLVHSPKEEIFTKDFEKIDRDPSLSL